MAAGYGDQQMLQGNSRAQFLLASMLNEILAAFDEFHRRKPRIFRHELENLAFNVPVWHSIRENLVSAIEFIVGGIGIDWERLRDVGLMGEVLEWKADVLYFIVGRNKPAGMEMPQPFQIASEGQPFPYDQGKPWYKRVWKYAKSLFGSLIEAVERDSRLRVILDAIKEYIECLEASVKFVREGAPDYEE